MRSPAAFTGTCWISSSKFGFYLLYTWAAAFENFIRIALVLSRSAVRDFCIIKDFFFCIDDEMVVVFETLPAILLSIRD